MSVDPRSSGVVQGLQDKITSLSQRLSFDPAVFDDAIKYVAGLTDPAQQKYVADELARQAENASAGELLGDPKAAAAGFVDKAKQALVQATNNNVGGSSTPASSSPSPSATDASATPTSTAGTTTPAAPLQAWEPLPFDETTFKAVTGDDAKVAYAQYLQGFGEALPGRDETRPAKPKLFDQWLVVHANAIQGPATKALSVLETAFAAKNGYDMPQALREEVLKSLLAPEHSVETATLAMALDQASQMAQTSNAQNAVAATVNNPTVTGSTSTSAPLVGGAYQELLNVFDAGGLLDKYAPWLQQDIISPYILAHPTPTQTKADQDTAISKQFLSALGRPPSAADLKALEGKSNTEITQYIDSQPINNGSGMQYGAYTDAYSRIANDWNKYLQRTPTTDEVARFASYSDTDRHAFIDKQPSHISGMNVGQYESYSKTVDQLANQYYGFTSEDFLHGLLKAQGKA